MAGYVFTWKNMTKNELSNTIKQGCFSTNINQPEKQIPWIPIEGTIADYLGMKKGDSIFFFSNRMIYGYGKLVEVGNDLFKDVKLKNYLGSMDIKNKDIFKDILVENNMIFPNNRWVCFFDADNHFFEKGVDMDVALQYKPDLMKSLRVMERVSFIKLDDEETYALEAILSKKNYINNGFLPVFQQDKSIHNQISKKVTINHEMTIREILKEYHVKNKVLRELTLEAYVMEELTKGKAPLNSILGKWDYLSHQVAASPFKPIIYMDKIDIFGYKYIEGLTQGVKVINDYLCCELKKDEALIQDVNQLMKYVDFLNVNYCAGDYQMINAVLVASDFSTQVINYVKQNVVRNYTIYSRDGNINLVWNNLILIKYKYNESDNEIVFEKLEV